MESHIIINWPKPGNWEHFIVIAEMRDGRWGGRRESRAENVTPEQLAVLQDIIGQIRGMNEPWTATHAVARLSSPAERVQYAPAPEPAAEGAEAAEPAPKPSTEPDAVAITLHARRDADGFHGSFTHEDIPALLVQSPEAVAAYNSFINPTTNA